MKPLCPPHSEPLKGRCLVVITEMFNFKEEGLVTPEVGEGENGILKLIVCFGTAVSFTEVTSLTKLYLIG